MTKSAISFFTIIVFFILLPACSETKQTVKAVGDTTVNVTKDVVDGTINTVDAIVPLCVIYINISMMPTYYP